MNNEQELKALGFELYNTIGYHQNEIGKCQQELQSIATQLADLTKKEPTIEPAQPLVEIKKEVNVDDSLKAC